MHTPRVKFTNIPLSQEIDWIYGFLFQNDWGWGKYIIKKHPELKKIYILKTEEKRISFLKKYIVKFKKENKKIIEKNKIKYQKEWQKIEKDFFITLSQITQTDWPKNKTIKAMISINPICPRFLNNWSFSIFFNFKKKSHAIETIMHECCHFLYFEKWKKLYPKMNHKKFESPYIEWHLSELAAPIILNDKRIQKLLKQKAEFYEEHKKIKIKDKTAPQYFTYLYKKNKNFKEFLNISYQIIKINKKLFDL
ncbi:MAG: hypothetical protein ABH881_03420 [bacterium]